MPKSISVYICQQCGYKSFQFLGKCPECGTWNSLIEAVEEDLRDKLSSSKRKAGELPKAISLKTLEKEDYQRLGTKVAEFDRVLGGGIVYGSLVLVSGDPGVGKSTLLTQLSLNIPKTLYVAGEESARQIKIRADRINPREELSVLNEVNVDLIVAVIREEKPALVIVDSVQTLETDDLSGAAGSVGQVRECAHRLQRLAKALHIPIFIVGHITKDGSIAGPKTLEHLVDVVLSLEGEQTSNFRILRASKNRFGPTDEVGIFEMEDKGMVEVQNPSKLFLEQKVDAPGSAVVATLNGFRPILVEIQALVTKSFLPMPRRTGSGVENF